MLLNVKKMDTLDMSKCEARGVVREGLVSL